MVAIVSYIQENIEGGGFLKAGHLVYSRQAEPKLKTHPQAFCSLENQVLLLGEGLQASPLHHLNRKETSVLPLGPTSYSKHQSHPQGLESLCNCRSASKFGTSLLSTTEVTPAWAKRAILWGAWRSSLCDAFNA